MGILIAAAAVSDYRAREIANQKIKKHCESLSLELTRTPDVLGTVGAMPASDRPFLVGFAAETEHLEQYALGKLQADGKWDQTP
jgi:phosphopantothenoylcysteine decarboxylase/phosphopantothenate--cysteine ligase